MSREHSYWRRLGRPVVVVATVVLALLGVIGNPNRPWVWILAVACALVVALFEIMAWRQEAGAGSHLGQNYEMVLSRVLTLISDLSDLTAREFDLWVVDLYLPRQAFAWFRRDRVGELELSMHVTLTDVRIVPSRIEPCHFFGRCFADSQPKLWWDIRLEPSSGENSWQSLNGGDNNKMAESYGVVSVNPIIDNLGRECRGLLVVHAKRDPEIVTKVLGVLQQPEGRRRMAAACLDIHGHLRKS